MRIGILGLGGIGGFIGAPLANHYSKNKDVEIIFICRGDTLSNIKSSGLTLKSPMGSIKVKPHLASDDPKEIGALDVIIVTVKSFSLQEVIKQYQHIISPTTIIITIQNGVNAKELIREVLPEKGTILEGCIYVASNVEAPGIIIHKGGPGKIFFGGLNTDAYDHITKVLQEGGLDITYNKNVSSILWSKYIFVSPVAAVTAAYDVSFGEIIEDNMLKNETLALMNEVKQLAEVSGIELDENIVQNSFDLLYKFPYEAKSSLQLDYELGNKTEREYMVDYVYHKNQEVSLSSPAYKTIMSLLDRR